MQNAKQPAFHGSDLEQIAEYYNLPQKEIISFGANVNPLGLSARVKEKLAENLDITAGTIGKAQDQHLLVVPVLFCCLKISLNYFIDRVTNLISVVSVRAERGKNLYAFTVHRKEVRL